MARGGPPLPRYRRLPLLLQTVRGPADVARVRYRTRGIAAAAPRRAESRARAVGTVNRRGRLRLTVPTSAPLRIASAARCGIGCAGRMPRGTSNAPLSRRHAG